MNITTYSFFRASRPISLKLSLGRVLLPCVLLGFISHPATKQITIETLSETFWAVSCYVAMTLAIYQLLSRAFSHKQSFVKAISGSKTRQVCFSAIMGALPGCGGAIVVTTQFVSGKLGFSSLVAVLVSTMGDAAFLLLATKPSIGFAMVIMGVLIGSLVGIVINFIHKDDFLRPTDKSNSTRKLTTTELELPQTQSQYNLQGVFWGIVIVPGAFLALLNSFQIDINQLLNLRDGAFEWLGASLLLLSFSLWAVSSDIGCHKEESYKNGAHCQPNSLQTAAQDTNFVSVWVVIAFLGFEFGSQFIQVDLGSLFNNLGIWIPLVGVLIGLLPGCGPQLLLTSLYLSGSVPLSAQIGNAISNDGDALFPAIAMAPKAALVATVYSSIPALLLAYSYWWFFE